MLVGAFVAAFKMDQWTSFTYNIVPIVFFMIICYLTKSDTQVIMNNNLTMIMFFQLNFIKHNTCDVVEMIDEILSYNIILKCHVTRQNKYNCGKKKSIDF
jgi:hypothetical protein